MTAPDTSWELLDLAERVEAGSGEDRRLDTEIENALGVARWQREVEGPGDWEHLRVSPLALTTSLDAVTALLERVLPLSEWEIATTGFKPSAVVIPNGSKHGAGVASSPARAMLAATLRALATQPKGDAS